MKILVLGGSGFLGSKLTDHLNIDCQSTYYSNQIFPNQIYLDLNDEKSIDRCLIQTKPDIIFHCGGLTETDFCEANPRLATRVNSFGTELLLKKFNGKLIYFSTDYVFDGESAPYSENSKPNPINHYGRTKLYAERKVLERSQNLVVRVSGLYGVNRHNNKFLNKIKSKTIRASTNLVSTPTYIEDIIKAIPNLIQMSGLLHFSGEQSFSRYEFFKKVVETLGLNVEIASQENNKIARRPRNSSLISVYKLKKTIIDEALNEMRDMI